MYRKVHGFHGEEPKVLYLSHIGGADLARLPRVNTGLGCTPNIRANSARVRARPPPSTFARDFGRKGT